jgi:hypothetical protein
MAATVVASGASIGGVVLTTASSSSGTGTVKSLCSAFGTAHDAAVQDPFFDRFKSLVGNQTALQFAMKCGDPKGESAIKKALAGTDIAASRLEEWAAGLGLRGAEALEFVRQGRVAEARLDKKRGDLFKEIEDRLQAREAAQRETRELLRLLIAELSQPRNQLSKQAIQLLRVVEERL